MPEWRTEKNGIRNALGIPQSMVSIASIPKRAIDQPRSIKEKIKNEINSVAVE